MNAKIKQLELQIIETLNNNDLPIELKRLILKEILALVEIKAAEAITNEMQEEKNIELRKADME